MGILASSVIDTALVTELISLVKSVMTLFSEFPLNVLLIASLAGVAITVVSNARSAASF